MSNLLNENELNIIFECGNKVLNKEIKRSEAINTLKEKITTHSPGSLAMYIDNYRHLRTGVPYGRNMSSQILEFFLEKINMTFGVEALNIALKSLFYHTIQYFYQTGLKQSKEILIGSRFTKENNLQYNFDDDMFNRNDIQESIDDKTYISNVNLNLSNDDADQYYEQSPKVKDKKQKNFSNFVRDTKVALHALANANYCCEIDKNHATFLRKSIDKNYTEPHHLIPICYQDNFNYSLDVSNNIVSLCSNCHNKLHYGRDIEKDLLILYNKRKDLLKKSGINISFSQLLELYK